MRTALALFLVASTGCVTFAQVLVPRGSVVANASRPVPDIRTREVQSTIDTTSVSSGTDDLQDASESTGSADKDTADPRKMNRGRSESGPRVPYTRYLLLP
jgi:hypothetical protein